MINEKRILALILALFILLGSTYALITPVFEASDELWHYPMVRHLADGNALPVQVFDPNDAGPWKQEASQPPLYYYLGAALTFWIDVSDMEQVRWLNPHVDNGIITTDGNRNLAIHDPDLNPWRGTLLAIRIVRLFSVLLGAVTVYLTYCIAREVSPERPEIALGAVAVNAITPMFLFISAAVNNDNLAIPLASLGVLLLIRAVTRRSTVSSHQYPVNDGRIGSRFGPLTDRRLPGTGYLLLIGTVIGLAVLTKQGTFALLPLAWGTLFIVRWQATASNQEQRTEPPVTNPPGRANAHGLRLTAHDSATRFWPRLLRAFAESLLAFTILLVPVILIAGWWYWRNIQLYGDFLGWSAFIAVLGARAQPASLAQLWDERWGFMLSYWGLFGGVNVPMATWLYHLLNGVVVVSVVGFLGYAWREGSGWLRQQSWRPWRPRTVIANLLAFVSRFFPLVICLLFTAAVVIGLIQWATTTWSSQGRLVFTAMSALNTLLVVGLAGLLPRRTAVYLLSGLAGLMLVIAALAPWIWIRPTYQPQAYHPPESVPLQASDSSFGQQLWLTGETQLSLRRYGVEVVRQDGDGLHPGDELEVVLDWLVTAPMDRDWSIFVHLNDPVLGTPIAQRDMYPGQGLRPTTLLAPGAEMTTFFRLQVPETAVAPANLEVAIGLYDLVTGERMSMELEMDHIVIGRLPLEPVAGFVPNPTLVNFMNEVELVGFELNPRRAQPGTAVDLTLYLRPQHQLETNYTLFAQIVDLEETTRWGSQDLPQPTATWVPGETYQVKLQLPLADTTPQRVFPIILGIYTADEAGNLQKLQLVTDNGRITQDDFLILTQIRID